MPAPSVRGLGGWSAQGASVRRRVRASAARRTGAPAGGPCAPGCPRRCQTSAPPAADPRHTASTPHTCPAGLGSVLRWKTGRSSLPQPGRVGGAASRAQTVASREQGRLAPGPRAAARGCNPFGLIPSTRSNRETARPLAPYLINTNNPRQRCPRSPKYLPSPEPLIPSFPDGRLSVRSFSTQFR